MMGSLTFPTSQAAACCRMTVLGATAALGAAAVQLRGGAWIIRSTPDRE